MILATVITCPQRWTQYQKLRCNFDDLQFPFPLRTFQNPENLESPFVNNILNARAAIQFAERRLPDNNASWLLYLEDDVRLAPEFPRFLPVLVDPGQREQVDCWYLCNRKNFSERRFAMEGMIVNHLSFPAKGSHALLLPHRHLRTILDAHWGDLSDQCIFRALGPTAKIWQIVHPVLVEHLGEISTFNPDVRQHLEINTCN
ncbi:MAG TPA: hypothetical protein VK850_14520 [Candidatus Binatia bacterium]|nr:hypothetical protein [Candidatus Binatia bacterium]